MKKVMILILLMVGVSLQGQITQSRVKTENYYGIYLIGKASDMEAALIAQGKSPAAYLSGARQSIGVIDGEALLLIEAWSITMKDFQRMRSEYNLIPLSHHQAVQIGAPLDSLRGYNGQRLIGDNGEFLAEQRDELLGWLWSLENQECPPVDFAEDQDFLQWVTVRGLKVKLMTLFGAFIE